MEKLIIIFLLFISCSNEKETKTPDRISPPTIEYDKVLKPTITVEEYYFHGKDSTALNLKRIIEYYSKDKIASESELLSSSTTQKGTKKFYDYQDTLLVQIRGIDGNEDSTRTVYHYNDINQLIKREFYTYEKRLRPEFIENQKRSIGWLISKEDFENDRSWDKRSEVHFTYDSNGRKIQQNSQIFHWDNQYKRKWIYDKEGNVTVKQSLENDKLIWTENYSYKKNEYNYTRTWNSENSQNNLRFYVFLNEKGEKIKEITIENDTFQKSKTTYEYYNDGMLKGKVEFDENNNPRTTYIYKK